MNISYTVKRSRKRRKTISLQVSNNSELIISAPYFTPVVEIDRFVQEKQNWIQKTIQKQKETFLSSKEKEYVTGEILYYLGEPYPLEVFFAPDEMIGLVFWDNRFYLNSPDVPATKKNYFVRWYKIKAREYLSKRVDFYGRMLNIQAGNVRITSAGSRWGSCSENNNLAFSFRLMMAKPDVIDYVVIHELMHIPEKNHSGKFWQLVARAMPDYKKHRRWLKDNHHIFIL